MKRIGILNLTRFGDLVQTSPVLTGLRKRHPEAELHLLVKTRFREIAQMLPCVDRIHEIDGDALARALADPDSSFLDAYRQVRTVVDELAGTHFDLVYNLTHSRASAVLLSLLDTERRVGYTIDREGLRHVVDPWLAHMGTVVRARRLNRLNLVDMYLGAAGLLDRGEPLSVHISATARDFAEARLPAGARTLAVQLGASSEAKTWPVARYAATLRALAENVSELRVVLVGVRAESAAAAALVEACPRVGFENLVGATRIPELAAVLERCELLLTGDTGTMHLAGAVGTRTCAVFVGLGTPWETAVYAEGHLSLLSRVDCAPCAHNVSCGHPVCHDDIPTGWLADLLARTLRGQPLDGLPPLPRADLFRSERDAHGVLDLAPLHVRPPTPNDLIALALRALFLERLGGFGFDASRVRALAQQRYGISPEQWRRVLPDTLERDLDTLARIGEQALRLATGLVRSGHDAQRIRETGEQLVRCDETIYEIARSEPLLAPLGLSLEGGLQGLPDGDLSALARASAQHYQALVRGARLLGDLLAAPLRAQAHDPDQGGPR